MIADGIGITHKIQPVHSHALAVVRRIQQTVHQSVPRIVSWIVDELFDRVGGGRQAGQVKRQPPNQRATISFVRRFNPFRFQSSENERSIQLLTRSV